MARSQIAGSLKQCGNGKNAEDGHERDNASRDETAAFIP
jgi:hypothetical protein